MQKNNAIINCYKDTDPKKKYLTIIKASKKGLALKMSLVNLGHATVFCK